MTENALKPQAAEKTKPTKPAAVGEGRGPSMDAASARAIAKASEKAGFPPPPIAAEAAQAKPESTSPAKSGGDKA